MTNTNLIAIYMGGEYQPERKTKYEGFTFDGTHGIYGFYKRENYSKEMPFHNNWNWIMLVIEKIKKDYEGTPKQFKDINLFSRKEEIYKAIVKFIKQYNKEKL